MKQEVIYMSQEYTFEFLGTKEDFLNKLGCHKNNDNQFFWFDSYMVNCYSFDIPLLIFPLLSCTIGVKLHFNKTAIYSLMAI